MRVYAVGDVHGCLKELKKMLRLIAGDLADNPVKKHRIIFLGDYVDRGPDPSGVVDYLANLVVINPAVTCLFGNHDQKIVAARRGLDLAEMTQFLRYGGSETLRSYGFSRREILDLSDGDYTSKKARNFTSMIKERVPKRHKEFLRNAPLFTVEGDYFFCHAGIRPDVALDAQADHDLIWIREPFLSHEKHFPKVIVHGHTKRTNVDIRSNRINIDTSCCYGGMLTAVVLEGTTQRFLTVPATRKYWLSA